MALFDPAAVNKQIDAYLATVPPGKRVTILGQADLMSKKASAALIVRPLDHVGAYVRVSKTPGQKVEADAGFTVSFLLDQQFPDDGFSYPELVEIFRARGWGWIRSHMAAYKLLRGWGVEL